jgi:predicted  nucleic acid-binding Zn-ribbon protein
MHPDLDGLIQLQDAESELRRLDTALTEIPRRRSELEEALAQEKGRLGTARAALEECQKNRRKHEGELQDLEVKRSKYKGQLNDVKTNKEYMALLHEIEGVEREVRAREDLILGEMETVETLTAEIKREEEHFKKTEERYRAEAKTLDDEKRALEARRDKALAARDAVASGLGTEPKELFFRIARLRGVAVAAARDGMCQLCHLKLRLQFYAELKRNDALVQCPACNRILYYDPPAPTVAPEP